MTYIQKVKSIVVQFLQQLRALKREVQLLHCFGPVPMTFQQHDSNLCVCTHTVCDCLSKVLYIAQLNICGAARGKVVLQSLPLTPILCVNSWQPRWSYPVLFGVVLLAPHLLTVVGLLGTASAAVVEKGGSLSDPISIRCGQDQFLCLQMNLHLDLKSKKLLVG